MNLTTGFWAGVGAVGGALVGGMVAREVRKHQGPIVVAGMFAGALLGGGAASPAAPATTTSSSTGTAGLPPTFQINPQLAPA